MFQLSRVYLYSCFLNYYIHVEFVVSVSSNLREAEVCVCVCVCVGRGVCVCVYTCFCVCLCAQVHVCSRASVSVCPLCTKSNRSAALTESMCSTKYLFRSDVQAIHSDNCQSRRSESLSERVWACNLLYFCQRVMSVMGHASYLYASQSEIETYKWTGVDFQPASSPVLIKALMSTGGLINAATGCQH